LISGIALSGAAAARFREPHLRVVKGGTLGFLLWRQIA
jgi:hypothetical protein